MLSVTDQMVFVEIKDAEENVLAQLEISTGGVIATSKGSRMSVIPLGITELGNEFAYIKIRKGEKDDGTVSFRGLLIPPADSSLSPGEFLLMLDETNKDLVVLANIGAALYRGAITLAPIE